NDMTAATRRKIESALLKVHREHPATFKNFCAGWTEFLGAVGFRRAADADYNTFRRMFGSNESLWKLLE
ncbi:MAG TPA: hypothetical protein VD996_04535, partial [Chitinophagaceae bacterium]|nr:hypothetical protein [Chitinophagaceae bacterium]